MLSGLHPQLPQLDSTIFLTQKTTATLPLKVARLSWKLFRYLDTYFKWNSHQKTFSVREERVGKRFAGEAIRILWGEKLLTQIIARAILVPKCFLELANQFNKTQRAFLRWKAIIDPHFPTGVLPMSLQRAQQHPVSRVFSPTMIQEVDYRTRDLCTRIFWTLAVSLRLCWESWKLLMIWLELCEAFSLDSSVTAKSIEETLLNVGTISQILDQQFLTEAFIRDHGAFISELLSLSGCEISKDSLEDGMKQVFFYLKKTVEACEKADPFVKRSFETPRVLLGLPGGNGPILTYSKK